MNNKNVLVQRPQDPDDDEMVMTTRHSEKTQEQQQKIGSQKRSVPDGAEMDDTVVRQRLAVVRSKYQQYGIHIFESVIHDDVMCVLVCDVLATKKRGKNHCNNQPPLGRALSIIKGG